MYIFAGNDSVMQKSFQFVPFVTGIIMLSMLSSCIYKDVEIVKLENVFVKQFSSKGIAAEVFLKVKNPNGYDITIVGSDLNIIINDREVGKATISDKITFPKKTENVQRFIIESDFEKLGSGVLATLASVLLTQSVKLGVKGDITAKALFLQKKIKVDFNENVGYTGK